MASAALSSRPLAIRLSIVMTISSRLICSLLASPRTLPSGNWTGRLAASLRDNRAECKFVIAAAEPARGRQCAEDRPVRRELLVGPRRDQGAGALVRQLGGQSRARPMADEAGIDFLLPIGRWKGYGGDTDYQGATLETVTWATGLLPRPSASPCSARCTRRCFIRSSPPSRWSPPITSARAASASTSSSAGTRASSRCSASSSATTTARYEYAQEWIDAIKLAGVRQRGFRFRRRSSSSSRSVRAKPKPYGGTRPLIMNAGASPAGRAFAMRNCDAFFTAGRSRVSVEETAQRVAGGEGRGARRTAASIERVHGRRRHLPADQKEAEEYYHHAMVEKADWGAVDGMLGDQATSRRRPSARRSSCASAASTPTASAACRSSAIPDHIARQCRAQPRRPDAASRVSLVN